MIAVFVFCFFIILNFYIFEKFFIFFRLYQIFAEALNSIKNLFATIIHKKHYYPIKLKKVGLILIEYIFLKFTVPGTMVE